MGVGVAVAVGVGGEDEEEVKNDELDTTAERGHQEAMGRSPGDSNYSRSNKAQPRSESRRLESSLATESFFGTLD